MRRLGALIVDDSALRRQVISELVEATQLATVVGTAGDGGEALRLVTTLKPDVITLDLDMPRVDGFGFLRLLMSARPTPVIVISSQGQRDNVFKALELGALDFLAVPAGGITDEAKRSLTSKLQSIYRVRSEHISLWPPPAVHATKYSMPPAGYVRPAFLVAIGASTGGPSAVTQLLSQLRGLDNAAVLVAQHMPASFTGAFAQRLDRYSYLNVSEARDGDSIAVGCALICPGNACMELTSNGQVRVRLRPPHSGERYVPSANQLLTSAAAAYGAGAVGVVLTGMGDDGAEGARRIVDAGGRVIVESEETCVVYGMPRAVLKAVPESISVPLPQIADTIRRCCSV